MTMSVKVPPENSLSIEWSERSYAWTRKYKKLLPFKSVKSRAEWPLILTGHGVSLRIERNALVIKNGFTHYPQEQEIIRLFPGSLELPTRIILLDCSGSISFKVLDWLQRQGVDLVHLNWHGEPIATTTRAGYSAAPDKILWQVLTRQQNDRRMAFCNELISQKLQRTISTLLEMDLRSTAWARAIQHAERALEIIASNTPKTVDELLVIEANCGSQYFSAWHGVTMAWRNASRRYIPSNWNGFDQRNSMNMASGNKNAHHPINALLNYAYRVAESGLLVSTIAEGFDPRLGILHGVKDGRYSFLCDLIELERATIDLKIFKFLRSNIFHVADFTIADDGVVRLNPQMARYVAGLVSDFAAYSISTRLSA